MKLMSRNEFLVLTQTYFADENDKVASEQTVSIEQAYESVRHALACRSVASDELRFTSKPLDGDLDMKRLEYK